MAVTLTSKRVQSIDLLRGTVMAIMVIDHVRDYFHYGAFLFDPTDPGRTNAILFFTRFITHFCAPVFSFLSGTSAYLSGLQKSRKQLSWFLFSRGLWLVIAEMTIICFGWLFNPAFPYFPMQVIWALGVSMMALSALVWLPERLILALGIAILFLHNLMDSIKPGPAWFAILHYRSFVGRFFIAYPVLPWIGIMALGYSFGKLYLPSFDAAKRKKWLIALGLSAIVLFIIIRSINGYGDPVKHTNTLISFLNPTKYPPSLCYALMTLGPALLFLAFTEKPLNRLSEKLVVFGRVPMFFYILHIYLIHLLAVAAIVISGRPWQDMILSNWVTRSEHLKGYGYPLWFVYVLWFLILVCLYQPCKWYNSYKKKHREKWWLSYI